MILWGIERDQYGMKWFNFLNLILMRMRKVYSLETQTRCH